jgi:hypothetical protein
MYLRTLGLSNLPLGDNFSLLNESKIVHDHGRWTYLTCVEAI